MKLCASSVVLCAIYFVTQRTTEKTQSGKYAIMNNKKDTIKIFEDKKVRSVWDAEAEKWYISIVDVVGVLTESVDGRKYWNKLKQRLKEEGNESVTNCHQLKLQSSDGKYYKTDVADVEQLFRLVQLNSTVIMQMRS